MSSQSAQAASHKAGAAFLRIGTGARPTAMGGAYTALADDVNALYYNPGGLGRLPQREIGATHTRYLLDTKFDFIGFAQPAGRGVFGLGVTRLAEGKIEARGADRQAVGGFEASDTAYTVGYSRAFAPGALLASGSTSLGVNAKLLHSRIGTYSANSLAFDLGAHHRVGGKPLSVGVSVLNIGKGMRYLDQTDPLPLTLAVGAAYRIRGLMQVALDIRHEAAESRTDVGIGTEYALMSSFSLRAGYASNARHDGGGTAGLMGGLGGGFGLKLGNYRADYMFTPFGQLGNIQRISLGARF